MQIHLALPHQSFEKMLSAACAGRDKRFPYFLHGTPFAMDDSAVIEGS
jgi:hypothetical protein